VPGGWRDGPDSAISLSTQQTAKRIADMIARGPILLAAAFLSLSGVAAAMVLSNQPVSEAAPAATTSKPEAAPSPEAAPKTAARPPLDERFVIKRILPITGPIKYGEWHWDEANAPETGPIVITVDLDARVLSIFRAGYEIGATAVLLGTQEKPTPLGVFPITQKKRHHVSNIYGAPMPYMQRLTNDGISLHASDVELGYASHGCIGMPEAFAAKVFEKTVLGDRVFITRGKMVKIGDSLVES
jgi:lipoprotein-anchoring transpeptidase ErfK/SrfK